MKRVRFFLFLHSLLHFYETHAHNTKQINLLYTSSVSAIREYISIVYIRTFQMNECVLANLAEFYNNLIKRNLNMLVSLFTCM